MKKSIEINKMASPTILIPDIVYSQVFHSFKRSVIPLNMHLLRPHHPDAAQKTDKKLPTLLWIIGGGFQSCASLFYTPEMAYFVKHGYQVAMIEYRVGGEGTFPASVMDVKTAVRFLRANADKFGVDSEKIAVMGGSAGGYLAAMLGTTSGQAVFETAEWAGFDSSVKAVIDLFGPADLSLMRKDRRIQNFLGTNEQSMEMTLQLSNPICHISEKTAPFLLFHGTEDSVVPYQQSQLLYDALQKHEIPSDFYLIQGAGHASDEFWQEETKEIILDFLNKYLN